MWRSITAISISIFLVSCSKSESSKETAVPPQVDLKTIDGRCLDLQSATQQMDHPRFSFPGFVYTRNFEVSAKAPGPYADSLMARSFRANSITFKGLPDLRGALQQGCDRIVTSEFGGRPVTYLITSSSPAHLELELDKNAFADALAEMSKHHKNQLSKAPMVKKFKIVFVSPTHLEVTSEYNAIPSECYKSSSLLLKEEVVYGWAESAGEVAQNARISQSYWTKLEKLAGTFTPHEEEELPAPIPAPFPPPSLAPASASVSPEDLVVNLNSMPATATALKTYAHPKCF